MKTFLFILIIFCFPFSFTFAQIQTTEQLDSKLEASTVSPHPQCCNLGTSNRMLTSNSTPNTIQPKKSTSQNNNDGKAQ